jgi:hypothetical protein
MTDTEYRVARAQHVLMDCVLRRIQQIEDALSAADIDLPQLDEQSAHAIAEWISARAEQREAESADPRR